MFIRKIAQYMFFFVVLLSASSASLAQSWTSDPIASRSDCLELNGNQVLAFVAKYYLPLLALSGGGNTTEGELVQSYIISSVLLTRSQICLAEALQIKGVTDDLKKQHQILISGTSMNDKKSLDEHRKLSENVNKKIDDAMKKNAELTPEQKKVFAVGTTIYGGATYAFVELNKAYANYVSNNTKDAKRTISGFTSNPAGALGGALRKGGTLFIISQNIARLWPMTVSTGKDIYAYSRNNDIEVDSDIAGKVGW